MIQYEGQPRRVLSRHSFADGLVAVWVAVIANPASVSEMDAFVVLYEGADRAPLWMAMTPTIPTGAEMETLYHGRRSR